MKQKILFILVSDEYVRNFFQTGIVNRLKKKFDLKFIFENSNIHKYRKLISKNDCLAKFDYSKKQIKDFNILNWSNSIINENLSKTFKFQNIGIFLNVDFFYLDEGIFKTVIKFIPRLIIKILKLTTYYRFKFFKNNEKLKKNYLNKYNKKSFIDEIKDYNPDLIIFPSRGNHAGLFDITNYCNEDVLLLCDNWDNHSSKSYLEPKPKFISVWGEQSRKHAILCNKYKDSNISQLGSPKYKLFYKSRNKKLKRYFKFKYFLVLESWIHDGIQDTLNELNRTISCNLEFKDYKVVFRPHPNPSHKKKYDLSKFKNVILDPDIKIKKNLKIDGRVKTNLNYYPSLIKNAEIVVCGPTTMLLESCMFYKKIILIGIDGSNFFNHKNCINDMEHLKQIKQLPNLIINQDLKFLNNQIKKIINKKFKINKQEIDKKISFFLTKKTINYEKNFEKCLKNLILK
jgi:hypothetical protein